MWRLVPVNVQDRGIDTFCVGPEQFCDPPVAERSLHDEQLALDAVLCPFAGQADVFFFQFWVFVDVLHGSSTPRLYGNPFA